MRLTVLLLLACLLPAPAHAAAQAPPVAGFTATYDVARNGEALGRATLQLGANADGSWTFAIHTQGTHGLARVIGLEVTEKSTFRWHDGRPQAIAYAYSMRSALRKRHHELDFQQDPPHVQVRDGKDTRDYPGSTGMIDRALVSIALIADMAGSDGAPNTALAYQVAGRNGMQTQHFRVVGTPTLELPAGTFATIQVQREHGRRSSSTWLSAAAGGIPVQMSHSEDDDDRSTIVMRLVSRD